VHRVGPGRHFYDGGDRDGSTDWLNASLSTATTQVPRDWVVSTSAAVLRAAAPFARTHVPTDI